MRWLLVALLFTCGAAWGASPCGGRNPCESQPVVVTPPSNQPPPVAVPAGARYVDCSAGTNGTGTLASPYNTLSGLTSLPTSTNVVLKAGTVCQQRLTVNWSGTASNRVVIGTYYVSGGTAYFSVPADVYANPADGVYYPNGAPAALQGTYRASCRTSGAITCEFGTGSNPKPNAVPTTGDGAMLLITGAEYVTVQDLVARDSAGIGFAQIGAGGDVCYSGCDDYTVFQRVRVDHAAASGIQIQRSRYSVVRDSEVLYTNLSWKDNLNNSWGNDIGFRRCEPCSGLVENNYTHDGYGEGIGPYAVTHVLIRGNVVSNTGRPHFYSSGHDIVIEQNTILGGLPQDEPGLGYPGRTRASVGTGIGLSVEPTTTAGGATAVDEGRRMIARNNLIAGYNTALWPGVSSNAATGAALGAYMVGNTAIGASGKFGIQWGGDNSRVDPTLKVNWIDNALATTTGQTGCLISSVTANVVLNHNAWVGTPTDVDCRGTGDTYATYANFGFSGFDFAAADKNHIPSYVDFMLGSSASALNTGVSLTSNFLVNGEWTWVLSQRVWKPSAQYPLPSEADFVKVMATDYLGATRGASPDPGAFERTP